MLEFWSCQAGNLYCLTLLKSNLFSLDSGIFKHQVGVVHHLCCLSHVTLLHIFQSSHLGAPYSWAPGVAGLMHGSAGQSRPSQMMV